MEEGLLNSSDRGDISTTVFLLSFGGPTLSKSTSKSIFWNATAFPTGTNSTVNKSGGESVQHGKIQDMGYRAFSLTVCILALTSLSQQAAISQPSPEAKPLVIESRASYSITSPLGDSVQTGVSHHVTLERTEPALGDSSVEATHQDQPSQRYLSASETSQNTHQPAGESEALVKE